jgi:hypothetical protein
MQGVESLLLRWLKRTRESSFVHYIAEERYRQLHYAIGVPAAILAAGVGTSVFVTLEKTTDTQIKILIGMVSILAAILTGLQTFLRYSERADRHRKAASDYSSIRREIEQTLVFAHAPHDVDHIRKRIDDITSGAPNVTPRMWATAEKRAASSDYFIPEVAPSHTSAIAMGDVSAELPAAAFSERQAERAAFPTEPGRRT